MALGRPWAGTVHWMGLGGLLWGGVGWGSVGWAGLGELALWLAGLCIPACMDPWLHGSETAWAPACLGTIPCLGPLPAWAPSLPGPPACLGTIPAWAPACQEGWTLVRLSEEAIRAISTA